LAPVLFTFYIQGVLKLKKNNSGAKSLMVLGRKRRKGQDAVREYIKRRFIIYNQHRILLKTIK